MRSTLEKIPTKLPMIYQMEASKKKREREKVLQNSRVREGGYLTKYEKPTQAWVNTIS